jgi:ATP-dependent Clp protease protease subunit
VQGQAVDIGIRAKEIIRLKQLITSYFAHHTGQTEETITRDTERDYYMSAREAVEYGIVDSVLTRDKNGKDQK